MRRPATRSGSRALLGLALVALVGGAAELYAAYFADLDPYAGIGAFFAGIGLATLAGPLFWLSLFLSPDAPRWLVGSALAGALASLALLVVILFVAGAGLGVPVAVALVAAGVTGYEARRRT